MGYGIEALQMLREWIGDIIPYDGSILEMGSQDINKDVPKDEIRLILSKIHKENCSCDDIIGQYFTEDNTWKVGNLFRGSSIRYRAIDIYPEDFVIEADLNSLQVPESENGSFDLITNFGTTEHVTDQVNVFRIMHDYLKVGGYCFHNVPFTGYFNHGLYNYNPIFFLFLAQANSYGVEVFNLSAPHLDYTIPQLSWIEGSENWQDIHFYSGIISCLFIKKHEAPFKLFTDFDRSIVSEQSGEILAQALDGRYDLRVRNTKNSSHAPNSTVNTASGPKPSEEKPRSFLNKLLEKILK